MKEESIGLEFFGFASVFVSPEKQKGLHTFHLGEREPMKCNNQVYSLVLLRFIK